MAKYFELEVSLIGADKKTFRRFMMPSVSTFVDLHEAIQDACGWEDNHLHSFQDQHGNEFAIGSEIDMMWASQFLQMTKSSCIPTSGLYGNLRRIDQQEQI